MSKIDDLTAFEASMAEKSAGVSVAVLADDDAPKLGLLGALAWVHQKRAEPTLTYDAFMQGSKSKDIYDYLFAGDEDESAEVDEDGFPDLDGGQPVRGDGAEPAGEAGDGEGGVLPGHGSPAE